MPHTWEEFNSLSNEAVLFAGKFQPTAGELKFLGKIYRGLDFGDEADYCLNLLPEESMQELVYVIRRWSPGNKDQMDVNTWLNYQSALIVGAKNALSRMYDLKPGFKEYSVRWENLSEAFDQVMSLV